MTKINATIALRVPTPSAYRPVNFPATVFKQLGPDDSTGRLSGIVAIGDTEVPFSMGEGDDVQYEVDGEYETNADLSRFLDEDVNEWEFRQYLAGVMRDVESSVNAVKAKLLEEYGEQLAAAAW